MFGKRKKENEGHDQDNDHDDNHDHTHGHHHHDHDNSSVHTHSTSDGRGHVLLEQLLDSSPVNKKDLRNFSTYAPLIAAIIAPLSTLLQIPALTQRWFHLSDGQPVRDPKACIGLSAVALGFNVFGNVLLVVRFSSQHRVNHAVSLSFYCWVLTTVIAIVNTSIFGAARNRHPDYHFGQGFWCAVVSVVLGGIISISLLFHYMFARGNHNQDSRKVQLTGRKFMYSITLLFVLIGLQALAFYRLEGWTYLDSIYFSVQTTLTVGYGDFVPTTTGGKIVIFPFAILTISQLANEISIIIDFVQDRAKSRRDKWRKRYSVAMHKAALAEKPYATLIDEICLVHQIELHQQALIQMYDLVWSFTGLIAFYVIGAEIFHAIEGWAYGNAVYAVIILSFSIGFGDFCPKTAAGRVVWIVYALMCVPIITNFATNTVTGIMYTISEHRFQTTGFRIAREQDPEAFAPHSHFILRNHQKWDGARIKFNAEMAMTRAGKSQKERARQNKIIDMLLKDPTTHDAVIAALGSIDLNEAKAEQRAGNHGDEPSRSSDETAAEEKGELEKQARSSSEQGLVESEKPGVNGNPIHVKVAPGGKTKVNAIPDPYRDDPNEGSPEDNRIEFKLCKALIDRVTHLESQSRQMLIDAMDDDLARTVLLADRNLQVRDALQLYNFGIDVPANNTEELDKVHAEWKKAIVQHGLADTPGAEDEDMLARVRRYRDTFAEILVISSTLLRLQNDDLKRFERWRTGDMHQSAKFDFRIRRLRKRKKGRSKWRKRHRADSQEDQHEEEEEDHAPENEAQHISSETESDIEHELCAPGGHSGATSDDDTTDSAGVSPVEPPEHQQRHSGHMSPHSREGSRGSHLSSIRRRVEKTHGKRHHIMGARPGQQVHRRESVDSEGPPDLAAGNDDPNRTVEYFQRLPKKVEDKMAARGDDNTDILMGHGFHAREIPADAAPVPHEDPCGVADVPTPSPTGPIAMPGDAAGDLTADPRQQEEEEASGTSAQASAQSPPSQSPPRAGTPRRRHQRHKSEQKFIKAMSKSVLKAADREANKEHSMWSDWVADTVHGVANEAHEAIRDVAAQGRRLSVASGLGKHSRNASETSGDAARRGSHARNPSESSGLFRRYSRNSSVGSGLGLRRQSHVQGDGSPLGPHHARHSRQKSDAIGGGNLTPRSESELPSARLKPEQAEEAAHGCVPDGLIAPGRRGSSFNKPRGAASPPTTPPIDEKGADHAEQHEKPLIQARDFEEKSPQPHDRRPSHRSQPSRPHVPHRLSHVTNASSTGTTTDDESEYMMQGDPKPVS